MRRIQSLSLRKINQIFLNERQPQNNTIEKKKGLEPLL